MKNFFVFFSKCAAVAGLVYAAYTLRGPILEKISFYFAPAAERGVSEMQKAHFEQAETSFRKAMSENAGSSDDIYGLAWSLQSQGKDSEALNYYKQAEVIAKR